MPFELCFEDLQYCLRFLAGKAGCWTSLTGPDDFRWPRETTVRKINMHSCADDASSLSVEHALSCPKGGFPSIRHNEIRDLTADLLTEVCSDVHIEPDLQPVEGELLTGLSANVQDGARLDIAANGFWGGRFERTYVRVFVTKYWKRALVAQISV